MIHIKKPGKRFRFGLKLSDKRYPRPLPDTYAYLKYKYPQSTWEGLSLRKQVCFFYLTWMMYPEKEHRSKLVEKVKEWRTGENRIGGQRSVLEKLCRKFFAAERKIKVSEKSRAAARKTGKKAFRDKTGCHSPEVRARLFTPEARAKRAATIRANSGHWWVYGPNGEVLEIHDLITFCRERGLDNSHLYRTAKYPGKTHKGWSARRRNVDLEGFTPGFNEPK